MANDPNRDLLPVKEDNSYKTGKGLGERIDHQILAKLSRCELEDKFLRLLDEQTHLKKLVNCQEEKIKRLGTKLLRLINEKKNGRKSSEQIKETEDLHLRIIELEHENYALKDKNTVLKQQVASHSRHITVSRSPVRSAHTSPLMSIRQSAPPAHGEVVYESTNKSIPTDAQLQEAENHIKKLKEEIKTLHNKIDYLQQNLERTDLDNRKTKVTENIELIRLQRSLKQQAIQIASLQAQVKNYENHQIKLREELIRAHIENDEALHLIAVKQNEILALGSKLEEKNFNRLEEDELKQRINDLTLERDFLKERSDFLMKAIQAKADESDRINELKKLLAEEKLKKEKLEEALETTQKCLQIVKNTHKESSSPPIPHQQVANKETNISSEISLTKKKDEVDFTKSNPKDPESPETEPGRLSPKCVKNCTLSPVLEGKAETVELQTEIPEEENSLSEGKYKVEKIKLERELQYMREMLRSQTSRCEAQQAEISRLMYELRVNDDKCNETLRKLDLHLKIFQDLEMRTPPKEPVIHQPEKPEIKEPVKVEPGTGLVKSTSFREPEVVELPEKPKPVNTPGSDGSSKEMSYREETSDSSKTNSPALSSYAGHSPWHSRSRHTEAHTFSQLNTSKKVGASETKKRFVDQVFLESSDEESAADKTFERPSFMRKLEEMEEKKLDKKKRDSEWNENSHGKVGSSSYNRLPSNRRLNSSSSLSYKYNSDSITRSHESQMKGKPYETQVPDGLAEAEKVKIGILWFKLVPGSSLLSNNRVKLLFVDFSFLDVFGEETETPESLAKPKTPLEKCEFNFSKVIEVNETKKGILNSLSHKPDFDLIVFKVVSDSEDFDKSSAQECEDVGVAVVTVKQFMQHCNAGPFVIEVKNVMNTREVVGTLSVSIAATPGIFSVRLKN